MHTPLLVALLFLGVINCGLIPIKRIPLQLERAPVYTNIWAVKHNGASESFFNELGFEIVKNVEHLDDVVAIRHIKTQRSRSASHDVTRDLLVNPAIEWAVQQKSSPRSTRALPTDPLFAKQWHLRNTGQNNGTVGMDVNAAGAWNLGYTGNGIVLAIVDDGLQHSHPDLSPKYQAQYSYDFDDSDSDPTPNVTIDFHGTSCAGAAGAASNNGECGVGVAYNVELAGLRILSTNTGSQTEDYIEASALAYKNQYISIYSNSWGPVDDGLHVEAPDTLVQKTFPIATSTGRGGLGNIYIWAAGNGGDSMDNSNYDGYANSRFTIAVAAMGSQGQHSYYSEPGANLLITAPGASFEYSDGIVTTDLVGTKGYDSSDCTSDFAGTSAAAPMAAGVVALLLEANPNLGWRDVQYILAKTTKKNDPTDADWVTNGAGLHVNHKYGFGLVDAVAAINMAKSGYTNLPAETNTSATFTSSVTKISDYPAAGVTLSSSVAANFKIMRVAVTVTINHQASGNLKIELTSPAGTKSVLSDVHGFLPALMTSSNSWEIGIFTIGTLHRKDSSFQSVTGQAAFPTPRDACSSTISNCASLAGKIVFVDTTQYSDSMCWGYSAYQIQTCGGIGGVYYDTVDPTAYDIPDPYPAHPITIPLAYLGSDDYYSGSWTNGKTATLGNYKYDLNDYNDGWTFTSTRHIDEMSAGTWTLTVTDLIAGDTGSISGAMKIDIFGSGQSTTTSATSTSSTSKGSTSSSSGSSTTSSTNAATTAASTSAASTSAASTSASSTKAASTATSSTKAASTTASSTSASSTNAVSTAASSTNAATSTGSAGKTSTMASSTSTPSPASSAGSQDETANSASALASSVLLTLLVLVIAL